MKKLSTQLKQNRTLNESAVDSRESFFRTGRSAIATKEGINYSEIDADAVLNSIYDRYYPSYVEMMQELTILLMNDSQKDVKARAQVVEIFTDLINNPNVSGFYPKLAKALSCDVGATIECYVHNLSMIAEHLNVTDIDLIQYHSTTMEDVYESHLLDVCTPIHAMEIVESALLLYSYIMANVPRGTDNEAFTGFYNDILTVYNEYKKYYGMYQYDIDNAREYFKSSLGFRDPSFYLSGSKMVQNVTPIATPLFLASFMNIFMIGYRNNDFQLNRRIIADKVTAFTSVFEGFLDNYNIFKQDLFILDIHDYSATRLKQYYQVALELKGKIQDPVQKRAFSSFLIGAKEICDELHIIEARMSNVSNLI